MSNIPNSIEVILTTLHINGGMRDLVDEDSRRADVASALTAVHQLIEREVIGEDMSLEHARNLSKVRRDETNGTRYAFEADAVKRAEYQNILRAEQRQRLANLMKGEIG